jgi:bifunctional non-homologous end joining protein LigD
MAEVAQQGLEGVVAKRLTSPYEPGLRSRVWIKTPIRHAAEVIIAGWAASSGNAGVLGALLLGAYGPDGQLVYVGDVGTGFTGAARRQLLELLRPLHRGDPPFVGEFVRARGWPGRPPGRSVVQWVQPRLVGEVEYRAFTLNRTTAGGTFRHPSWRGLRDDKSATEVAMPSKG